MLPDFPFYWDIIGVTTHTQDMHRLGGLACTLLPQQGQTYLRWCLLLVGAGLSPLADRCPCSSSLVPPQAALTFAAIPRTEAKTLRESKPPVNSHSLQVFAIQ